MIALVKHERKIDHCTKVGFVLFATLRSCCLVFQLREKKNPCCSCCFIFLDQPRIVLHELFEYWFGILVACVDNFIELVVLQHANMLDWWQQVKVGIDLAFLDVPFGRRPDKQAVEIHHRGNVDGPCKRVHTIPKDPPTAQTRAVVVVVSGALRADVHRNHRPCLHGGSHHVGWNNIHVTSIDQVSTIFSNGRQIAGKRHAGLDVLPQASLSVDDLFWFEQVDRNAVKFQNQILDLRRFSQQLADGPAEHETAESADHGQRQIEELFRNA
mmetsp:Transcript_17583/g.49704  ORF Transcript_17583/g.49704 Transcript_17583/m.49704 type:complete len:270 (+) Transcript_17583:273-1082(+)